jgi:predicted RNase H-like HicB family nuclease
MLSGLTARYVKIPSGYMGQILEWPEVITEGVDIEDCRKSLEDAAREMVLAYHQLDKEIPVDRLLLCL